MLHPPLFFFFFFFNDTATTEIYTLSLHDALPIYHNHDFEFLRYDGRMAIEWLFDAAARSEEHTSELQSHSDLVCRLLLEKKKKIKQKKNNEYSKKKEGHWNGEQKEIVGY